MTCSEIGSKIFFLCQTIKGPKFKIFGFAISIIVGIGSLVLVGIGTAEFLHACSLPNLGEAHSITMLVVGGVGVIPLLVIGILRFVNRCSGNKIKAESDQKEEKEEEIAKSSESAASPKKLDPEPLDFNAKSDKKEEKEEEIADSSESTTAAKNLVPEPSDFRPTLPKYVFSENGSLSLHHFLYYLKKDKPENQYKLILWAFTQRKFQGEITICDTQFPIKNSKPLDSSCPYGLRVDQNGYAISKSSHRPDLIKFIEDAEIKQIHHCVRFEKRYSLKHKAFCVYAGQYEDGKWIIHQPAVRGCVFTSACMVLFDKGVGFEIHDLFCTNLEDDNGLERLLKKYNYTLKHLGNSIPQLQDQIAQHGSLLVSIDDPSLGGHEMVLDAIDENEALIRDPAHGWRLSISTKSLFDRRPKFKAVSLLSENL